MYNVPSQMFDRVLNLPRVLSIPGFWIYLCSECARVLHMPLVLNVTECWIYQSSEYAGVTQGSEYAWIFSTHVFYIAKSSLNYLRTIAKIWKLLCDCKTFFACGRVFSSLRSLFLAVQLFYVNSKPTVNSPHWPEM